MQRIYGTGRLVLVGVLVVLAASAFTGCASQAGQGPVAGDVGMPMQGASQAGEGVPAMTEGGYMVHAQHVAAPNTMLPAFASTPDLVRYYTFAYQHPEVLSYMPCSCGCATMGHASNWNCYVRSVDANGVVTFDQHATGCTICLDITSDVMRLYQRGSPLSQIRDFIDANYPDNQTPTDLPL